MKKTASITHSADICPLICVCRHRRNLFWPLPPSVARCWCWDGYGHANSLHLLQRDHRLQPVLHVRLLPVPSAVVSVLHLGWRQLQQHTCRCSITSYCGDHRASSLLSDDDYKVNVWFFVFFLALSGFCNVSSVLAANRTQENSTCSSSVQSPSEWYWE